VVVVVAADVAAVVVVAVVVAAIATNDHYAPYLNRAASMIFVGYKRAGVKSGPFSSSP